MNKYDIIIIGAGPGGYVAALYAAGFGKKVLVIEKGRLGGVCLNCGCIPTKTLLESVKVLNYAKHAKDFGIDIPSCDANYLNIKRRKDEVVNRLRSGIESLFKAKKIELKIGSGRLVDRNVVEVNGERFEAGFIIIATGTNPMQIPNFKFNNKILSSASVLNLEALPKKMLIIGGGVNGCEYAYTYSSLGVDVTIVELMDRLLPTMDKELSKNMQVILKKKGVKIMTKTRLDKPSDVYEKTVVCVGRKYNTEGIGLKEIDLKTEKGAILVDKNMKTNIPCVYAIGDVTGGYLLAHVASHEGIIAAENILGRKTEMDYRSVPICIYTDPQIASVGLSEQEAQKKGHSVRVSKLPFRVIGKAQVMNDTEGFVKILGDEKNNEVLGIQIVGSQAGDLIAEAHMMVRNRMRVKEIKELIHAHPTLSEAFTEAAFLFEKTPLHTI